MCRLYGDYESLIAGYTADALVDFTGGVAEKMITKEMGLGDKEKSYKFFTALRIAVENKSLVNVFIQVMWVVFVFIQVMWVVFVFIQVMWVVFVFVFCNDTL